ncbi:MAG: hypothetical protein ACE5DO_01775 [Desulfobacterales bacterium]
MNWKIIKITVLTFFLFPLMVLQDLSASDSVEWTPYMTMQLEAAPIDVAISPDGRRIFVLTDKGEILIYSATSNGEVKMDVGTHVDQIKMGPGGDSLILNSNKNKTVQIITLDFIQKIDISDSPYRGVDDAPVVIAVFDDFQ